MKKQGEFLLFNKKDGIWFKKDEFTKGRIIKVDKIRMIYIVFCSYGIDHVKIKLSYKKLNGKAKITPIKSNTDFVGINPNEVTLNGYFNANKLYKCQGLSIHSFEKVKFVRNAVCTKTKQRFIEANGMLNGINYRLSLSNTVHHNS